MKVFLSDWLITDEMMLIYFQRWREPVFERRVLSTEHFGRLCRQYAPRKVREVCTGDWRLSLYDKFQTPLLWWLLTKLWYTYWRDSSRLLHRQIQRHNFTPSRNRRENSPRIYSLPRSTRGQGTESLLKDWTKNLYHM